MLSPPTTAHRPLASLCLTACRANLVGDVLANTSGTCSSAAIPCPVLLTFKKDPNTGRQLRHRTLAVNPGRVWADSASSALCAHNGRCGCLVCLSGPQTQEGALQPVINLLSSSCPESQREAALLLGQFATQTPNDDGPGEHGLGIWFGPLACSSSAGAATPLSITP